MNKKNKIKIIVNGKLLMINSNFSVKKNYMKTGPKPRIITSQLLEQIEIQASRGLSQQQICHSLEISESW